MEKCIILENFVYFYSYFRNFSQSHPLCPVLGETCKKKSENVIQIWVARGSEESIIFIKFMKCCYFHYLYGLIGPTAPPSLQGYGKWCCQTFCFNNIILYSFTNICEA